MVCSSRASCAHPRGVSGLYLLTRPALFAIVSCIMRSLSSIISKEKLRFKGGRMVSAPKGRSSVVVACHHFGEFRCCETFEMMSIEFSKKG
ncbi:hypothetical protein LIA77_09264 [Sarocladium implicatum]|nr:hypothetical protein LIA77_09264 [Sarocladium implicatum]